MRFLIIAQDAGSSLHGMVYRPYYVAKYLVRQGHQVCVMAAQYSHLRRRNPECSGVERIDGIEYHWLPSMKYSSTAVRAINVLWVAFLLWLRASRIARQFRPDVVVLSSPYPFHIYGAERIARAVGAQLVFEVRDLWPLTLIELGKISPSHPYVRLMGAAERRAYRVADRVVSVLPAADEYMIKKGMAPGKFAYIPNGIDPDEWSEEEGALPNELVEAIKAAKSQGRFIVGYLGAHGLANSLEPLLRAIAEASDIPVTLLMVGHGPEREMLRGLAEDELAIEAVFFEPIPKSLVPSFLRKIDAAYLGWLPNPLYRYGISANKMMDYLMAGVPVIHATNAVNDPIADAGAGVSVTPGSVQEIAAAIRKLHSLSAEERVAMSNRAQEHATNFFGYPVLIQRYLRLVAHREE